MKYFSLITLAWCIGCSSVPTELWAPTPHPPLLDNAVFLKSQKKLDQAEVEVQSYLDQSKDIYWQGAALLLMGEIQEERSNIPGAMATYRQLLNHGAGYETFHVAKSLYKLSWLYEQQNNCKMVIANLTDLQKVLLRGDEFIKGVETPARLANCYYILNQWERAKQLRSEGLRNLQTVSQYSVPDHVRWRVFLYLSFLGVPSLADTDRHFVDVIGFGQKDMLHLIEQAPAPYNEIAFGRLLEIYEALFMSITKQPKPKNAVEKNETNQMVVKELATLVDLIEVLKAERSPEALKKNNTEIFFMKIQNIEERSRNIVRQLELGMQKEKKRTK